MLNSSERKVLGKINFLQKKSTANKSRFQKNNGIDFRQLREYVYGDDIRCIDWKSSARTQKLVVKEFSESISADIFLILDLTKSTYLGVVCKKNDLLKKAAYALAWRAIQQKCQLYLAVMQENNFVTTKIKTENELLNIFNNLHSQQKNKTTLDSFIKQSVKGTLIIVSDFLDERLNNLASKNKIFGLRYLDHSDLNFVNYFGYVADPETGGPRFIDYAGSSLKKINQKLDQYWQNIDKLWLAKGWQIINLDHDNLIFRLVKSLEGKL